MIPEFMRVYEPGTETVRCGGDDGCGALVVSGDTELHTKWHEKIEESLRHARSIHPVGSSGVGHARGGW